MSSHMIRWHRVITPIEDCGASCPKPNAHSCCHYWRSGSARISRPRIYKSATCRGRAEPCRTQTRHDHSTGMTALWHEARARAACYFT